MTIPTMQYQTERVDDIPLVIGFLQRMNLPTILEEALGSHHLHQGISNGWLATVWIAFILSEGNHCKVAVQDWANSHQHTLATLLEQPLRPVEFSDDRLGIILRRFHDADWDRLEDNLWNGTCLVYDIPFDLVRLDSTTSYGFHEVEPGGLLQYGHSKDHRPDLPQFKLMAAVAQPTSHAITSDIVPGNCADDPLYVPLIGRTREVLGRTGLLYAGDSKMAALATRGYIVHHDDYYLMPLPRTGETAAEWDGWIGRGIAGEVTLQEFRRQDQKGKKKVFARGYEFTRECRTQVEGEDVCWKERVQVLQSLALAEQQRQGLEKRLQKAEQELGGLTPPPGRGIHPYRQEAELQEAIGEILQRCQVEGLLAVTVVCAKDEGGRKRGGDKSAGKRYRIAAVGRCAAAIEAAKERLGWRVQATNQAKTRADLEACVWLYNGGWSGERGFHVFKDKPIGIQPLYVREEEQIEGMIRLLMVALRALTLFEVVVRAGLAKSGEKLEGLYEGQAKRKTSTPTAIRMLKAVVRMGITAIKVTRGRETCWYLTKIPTLLQKILMLAGIALTVYTCLGINSS